VTITIWEKDDFRGTFQIVSGDIADLKGQLADKPGSAKLTERSEAILMFKNDDWHGGALYLRGLAEVADLGKDKDGGRLGFGNCVRSVRVTPFKVDLNVNVITNGSELPGDQPGKPALERLIADAVDLANDFLAKEHALLKLVVARVTYRNDPKQFAIGDTETWSFPGEWKEKDELDVMIVDRFSSEGVGGLGKLPSWGKVIIISLKNNPKSGPDKVKSLDLFASNFVHEVGHYFGLMHGSANGVTKNIMFGSTVEGQLLSTRTFNNDQIREMQDRLANHHTRRGDRDD